MSTEAPRPPAEPPPPEDKWPERWVNILRILLWLVAAALAVTLVMMIITPGLDPLHLTPD